MRWLLATILLLTTTLAGCFGFDPTTGGFDYVPGQDFEPTGKTVHLKANVVDWIFHEVFPGFHANLWAFCMEANSPDDQYSVDAVEYWSSIESDGVNDPASSAPALDGKCSVPAPTLRVKQGDTVRVDFSHAHFHCHTIHWHGQHLPWTEDGVPGVTQDSVCTNDSFTYEFVAARAGTLWYHCHVDVQFHVMQGLFGLFIVEPQDDRWEPKDIDEEYNIVFSTLKRDHVQVTPERIADPHKDHRHESCGGMSGLVGCQNPPTDVTADTWMLNGRTLPYTVQDEDTLISVNEGDRIRLRILNAGETLEQFHTHGHDMLVTHVDGNPLHPSARYYVDTLSIGPASRYDVVIDMNLPGLWVAHTHVDSHVTNSKQAPGGAFTMIVYEEVLAAQGGVLRGFESELIGGLPYIEPLAIPGDVVRGITRDVTGDPLSTDAINLAMGFPVTMPCAVRELQVDLRWDPQFPHPQESLSVDILDGDDRTIVEDAPLNDQGEFHFEGDPRKDPDHPTEPDFRIDWLPGNFTVRLQGTATAGSVALDYIVDYYEDESQFVLDGRDVSGTACDPTDRIFDPSPFKPT